MIVPCKNEAEQLQATLTALANQVDLNGHCLPKEGWEVLLLVNNSTDNSFAVASNYKQAHAWLALQVAECHFPAEQANVGHARRLLMDTACERLSHKPNPFSLIVSTDADTEVAPDWLAQNLAESRRGAEAIGGRISLHPSDLRKLDKQTKHIQRWDDRYHLLISWLEDLCDSQAHDPWPRHHQHFAASFAVRPEIYRQVGGLPPKESLEDMAFYDALMRQDVHFRHSPNVCVHTSGRSTGRTTVGLAEQLNRWSNGPSNVTVPSVGLLETLFSLRKRLRALWRQIQAGGSCRCSALESLSAECGGQPEELEGALRHKWFGTAWESLNVRRKLEEGVYAGNTLQPLEEAVRQLQKRFYARHRHSDLSTEEVQSGISEF